MKVTVFIALLWRKEYQYNNLRINVIKLFT